MNQEQQEQQEEQKLSEEEQKKIKRNQAVYKYRMKDLDKWRERAKVLAKNLYNKNKNNPEYLAKKRESAKKSYHLKKQMKQEQTL